MSRPKGSKNRKTLVKNVNIEEQLSQKTAERSALEAEQAEIQAILAENNVRWKAVRKSIRALDRQIAALQAKQAEIEAAAVVSAKQKEIQETIQALVAEGKSLDDILNMLR